mgnify:CR=1 FL=1
MTVTEGEFIVIFDCDHVPSCDFLLLTMGWLVKDPKIALVQTPHHFYSPDPFEKNMHLDRRLPIEKFALSRLHSKGQRHVECHHVLRVFCRQCAAQL